MVRNRSRARVAIIDYGTGNIHSVRKILERLVEHSLIVTRPSDLASADKIILPGVGHFDRAINSLRETGMLDALNEAVQVRSLPVLGICLGMELMAETSEEGTSPGIGWLKGRSVRFRIPAGSCIKVPHMGWNQMRPRKPSRLMDGLDEASEFYFAHSYHLELENVDDLLAETEYGVSFPSAVERENIFGVQYHPEKSHDAGERLLRNFVDL